MDPNLNFQYHQLQCGVYDSQHNVAKLAPQTRPQHCYLCVLNPHPGTHYSTAPASKLHLFT